MKSAALAIDYSDLSYGKYDEPITVFIDAHLSELGMGDEEEYDGQGNGTSRYGRRVYSWDDQGFQVTRTFATVEQAENWFADFRETCYTECEKCGEKVHNDTESWYEHDKYECGSDEFNGQAVRVDHRPGVAWRVVKTYARSYELVMVGDNRVETFDIDDVHSIDEDDYCSECGQIGCTADGRE